MIERWYVEVTWGNNTLTSLGPFTDRKEAEPVYKRMADGFTDQAEALSKGWLQPRDAYTIKQLRMVKTSREVLLERRR